MGPEGTPVTKKILHVFGGVRAYKMCRSLVEDGWEAHKVAIQDPAAFEGFWRGTGVHLQGSPTLTKIYKKLVSTQFLSVFKAYLPLYLLFPPIIDRAVRKNNIKLVQANRHTGAAITFLTQKLFLWPKDIKIIFDYHDPWSAEELPHPNLLQKLGLKFFYWLESYIVKNSQTVITQGEEHTEILEKRYPFAKGKFVHLYNPPDHRTFKPLPQFREQERKQYQIPKDAKTVVFIGSIIDYFGLGLLPEAAPKVVKAVPKARFVILGVVRDKPHWDQVNARIKELGLDDYFIRVNPIPNHKVPAFLSAQDVGLITHMRGSLICETAIPNKIFEYMACGLPVVTSDLSNLTRFILPYKSGISFKANDSDSLAQSLIKILKDDAGRKRMGRNARVNVEKRFNWQLEMRKLENAYERALAG